MTLALWLEIIKGVLAFPDAVLKLVRVLSSTPQENHDKIINAAQAESDKFKETGLPTW